MTAIDVSTGVRLNVKESGSGEPLLLIMGTSGSLGIWGPVEGPLAGTFRVISFDNRGLGESERGEGEITMASLARDAAALLDALDVPRAHVLGWSLGSAVAQELALAAPEKVGSLVLYATWGRLDNFMNCVLTALRHPWTTGDLEDAFTALGIAFSPELLNSPQFEEMLGEMLPLFPSTEAQVRTTLEQWEADRAHDTLDRLGGIQAPTLVIAGEQDLLTPPWQCKAVADEIPGAEYRLLTGPGSSHALMFERGEEFLGMVSDFLTAHPLEAPITA
ncbi:MAG TPA: alpha/beta fold hydrolase [Solirubrobacteraceae bacterium]|jgi:pimeloyl-ACP methyl ester carboxylesterase